jgi:hypothetical protein
MNRTLLKYYILREYSEAPDYEKVAIDWIIAFMTKYLDSNRAKVFNIQCKDNMSDDEIVRDEEIFILNKAAKAMKIEARYDAEVHNNTNMAYDFNNAAKYITECLINGEKSSSSNFYIPTDDEILNAMLDVVNKFDSVNEDYVVDMAINLRYPGVRGEKYRNLFVNVYNENPIIFKQKQ